ncbi:39S ribosomal protein L37, mitochondrial isoform X2 [Heterodontus francisci]|uniref:39S ribosomal protein L37, mitochondrial isoform X2 n=1 Tax=Heterodontus francisci TaxID=7792 RepID=UPI00355C15A5
MWKGALCVGTANLVPAFSGRRLLYVAASLSARAQQSQKKLEPVEIPGLEPITYWDRMHYVPGLADPKCPVWDRGWEDPFHRRGPKYEEMPLYKGKPCYTFHQRTKMLEGVKQALWLTKSKLIEGLPKQILSIAEDPANRIEDQDERVKAAVSHARFWTTTEIRPKRDRFCPVLMQDLLHLCRILQPRFPTLGNRILAENYSVAAMWERGFRDGYPFPHAHTLYITESSVNMARFREEPLRAKMIMFTFANALARAKLLYGEDPKVLDNPITVQCIATNGRIFQFLVLQLNTTDLQSSNDGVKNLIWLDRDQLLYDYAKCLPTIRKKMIQVPAGLSGYCPETFSKFLALYLHGAV